MSQFPPSPTPPDDEGAAPTPDAPRRLISPQERFAEPVAEAESVASETEFVEPENPFEAQLSARQRDEMERRHLPPRERARRERTRLSVDGATSRRRAAPIAVNYSRASPEQATAPGAANQHVSSESRPRAERRNAERGNAERDFVQNTRTNAPVSPAVRRRVPLWMKRLLTLVALIFVGQLGFAALTAPQFNIETVEIQGIDATPSEQVQPLARTLVGQNLVRVNARAAERAISQLPTIASAKVVRLAHWPPKVALQIRERQPFLKIGAGTDWWVVDENGVPFRRPTRADAAFYSAVAPQFAPQLRRPLEAKSWERAKRLAMALQADNRSTGEKARWQLRRIYFDRDGMASLRLASASHREMLLRLGDDAWPAKLARARQSLSYFERTGRRPAELDLVSLERPVWTPIAPRVAAQSRGTGESGAG